MRAAGSPGRARSGQRQPCARPRAPGALGLLLVAVLALACHRPAGRLHYASLDSQAEGKRLRYGVYLPPGYDGTRPLPLVLLLHGAGDDHTAADRDALIDRLDRAVQRGQLPAFVLAAPEGERGFWLNWHDGSHRYRDWVLDELVAALRARYPLQPEPAGLHLLGVSMGGGGGLQLWLRERARFASVSVLSAPILNERDTRAFLRRFMPPEALTRVFGPEGQGSGIDPYRALAAKGDLHGSRLVFGAAQHDRAGILDATRAFHRSLRAHGVPHHFLVFSGKHRWSTWSEVIPYALCLQLGSRCERLRPAGLSEPQ